MISSQNPSTRFANTEIKTVWNCNKQKKNENFFFLFDFCKVRFLFYYFSFHL